MVTTSGRRQLRQFPASERTFIWDAKLANRHPASLRSYMEYKCGPTATGAPFVVNGNIRTEYMCTYFSCDVNLETRGSPKNNRYLNPYRLLTLFTDVFVCP